jgi:predicted RNase H-like HicB family nuclease
MLTHYITGAMHRAHFELMENGRFFGSIPECPGVWGEGATLETCRDELQEVLEDWILIRLRQGLDIPVIDGVDINPQAHYAEAD